MDKFEDAPGKVEEADTLPPTVPMAYNVAMKLPAFWLYAAKSGSPSLMHSLQSRL